MIKIKDYVRVGSLEEAYELNQKRSACILGGMLWTKMGQRQVQTAIDLSGLGLDQIEESEEEFSIGCMVTLRQMEEHEGLNAYTDGAARESVRSIVGVQFRNLATVGGSIFGRFGFSDVLTLFLALDTEVELVHAGRMPLAEFACSKRDRDVLVRLIVKKHEGVTVYQSHRNSRTDFPVLTCAVRVEDGKGCAVLGAKQMYQDLLRGGIVNSAGEAPLLVERKRIDGKQENCLLTFKIKGLPLERWKDLSPTIAASLGVYVVEIKEGAEPYTYTVHTVANDALPTRIDWSPSIIPDRPTKFALGEAVTGTVYADIRNDPGILTASATGGGKTMETKGIAAQALCRDYILIVADYKYVEYGGIWGSKGTYIVHDDENLLWVMQRLIERLHDRRDWLAEHDCRNIDDYNERYPDNKLRRVMLLIDEAAIALDTRTQNKAKKAARQEIVEAVNELACTGRFVGFSFLISLQRPSAEVLSGELRNNLTIRLVGKSDANLSMLALDNADAAKLIPSDTPGRFLTSNGEILQGYYFEDTMLRNLPDKKSPAWEFLMNGENLYHQMTMQELEEKNKTKGEDKNEQ